MVLDYISTRGGVAPASFAEVAISGLAPDGGLYVPSRWPTIDPLQVGQFRNLGFTEIAQNILGRLVGAESAIDVGAAATHMAEAFSHPDVVPLKQIGDNLWLQELFHGPTYAFKDVAMQFLSQVIGQLTAAAGRQLNILTATSGDTGAAAVYAFKNCKDVCLFTLFPHGRVSDVQRRQMTTVAEPNIFNIAIEGTFDDCQHLVKSILADVAFKESHALTTVNSVNWARIAAQITYYFFACSRLPASQPDAVFVVPTGNLGNAYSGYAARCMGAPIDQIILASNQNDSLARAFATQVFRPGETIATASPAMDIQNASNFERLIFECSGRDGNAVGAAMGRLDESGCLEIPAPWRRHLQDGFQAISVNDADTMAEIRRINQETGQPIDPHTAVAVAAASKVSNCGSVPKVILATADAAKFPETVNEATGKRPAPPEGLRCQLEAPEHFETMTPDPRRLREFIAERANI